MLLANANGVVGPGDVRVVLRHGVDFLSNHFDQYGPKPIN